LVPPAAASVTRDASHRRPDSPAHAAALRSPHVGYWFRGRPTIHQLWQDLGDVFRRTMPDFDPTRAEARAAWQTAAAPVG
jgi:hypothetical protein